MKKDFIIIGVVCGLVGAMVMAESMVRSGEVVPMINIMNLPDINEIDLNFPCQLYIQKGEEQKITMEGSAGMINMTGHKIKSGRLVLRQNNLLTRWQNRNKNSSDINIYITLSNIRNITISSSPNGHEQGFNAGERLSMKVGNSGAIIIIKS